MDKVLASTWKVVETHLRQKFKSADDYFSDSGYQTGMPQHLEQTVALPLAFVRLTRQIVQFSKSWSKYFRTNPLKVHKLFKKPLSLRGVSRSQVDVVPVQREVASFFCLSLLTDCSRFDFDDFGAIFLDTLV